MMNTVMSIIFCFATLHCFPNLRSGGAALRIYSTWQDAYFTLLREHHFHCLQQKLRYDIKMFLYNICAGQGNNRCNVASIKLDQQFSGQVSLRTNEGVLDDSTMRRGRHTTGTIQVIKSDLLTNVIKLYNNLLS